MAHISGPVVLLSIAALACTPPPVRSARIGSFDAVQCLVALDAYSFQGGLPDGIHEGPGLGGAGEARYREHCSSMDPIAMQAQCDARDLHGCLGLGLLRSAEGDLPGARLAFARACDGGEPFGCYLAGMTCERIDDDVCAEERLQRACGESVAVACGAWAMRRAGREDIVGSACVVGYLPACRRLESEPDPSVAAQAARELCEAGTVAACLRAVEQWAIAPTAPFDVAAAVHAAQVGCDGGVAELCDDADTDGLRRRRARSRWAIACEESPERCVADVALSLEAQSSADGVSVLAQHCAGGTTLSTCETACQAQGAAVLGAASTLCQAGSREACSQGAALVRAGCGSTDGAACARRFAFSACATPHDCPGWDELAESREEDEVACALPRSLALRLYDAASLGDVRAALLAAPRLEPVGAFADLLDSAPRVFPSIDFRGNRIAIAEPVDPAREAAVRLVRTSAQTTARTFSFWQPPAEGMDAATHHREVLLPLLEALPEELRTFRPMRRVNSERDERTGAFYERNGRRIVVSMHGRRHRYRLPASCDVESFRVWLDPRTRWVLVAFRGCDSEMVYHIGQLS